MDWQLAIEKNRTALLQIVTALYALAGIAQSAVVQLLPQGTFRILLRLLRPAESAARRLIILAARGLVYASRAPRPAPLGLKRACGAVRLPAFNLIDPLKRPVPIATRVESLSDWLDTEFVDTDVEVDESDAADEADFDNGHPSLPRISVPGIIDPAPFAPVVFLPPGMISAAQLTARLAALHRALNNLPGQARRLARWHARRKFLRQHFPSRIGRLSPVRPGAPPGLVRHSKHEVHAILRECHLLMLDTRFEAGSS